MPDQSRDVTPGPDRRSVRTEVGRLLRVPRDWVLVPPGDAALTRRAKAAGPAWTMKERRGRRTVSLGVWTDKASVDRIRADLAEERADPAYAKKLAAGKRRRDAQQATYEQDFDRAVRAFLAFAPQHAPLAVDLAAAITRHAIPVGSGTVARTRRIPIPQRAEAATIAWLRHQTTGYDDMHIPAVRGMRREVRGMLAERSRKLLQGYRDGREVDPARCPLRQALVKRGDKPPASGKRGRKRARR